MAGVDNLKPQNKRTKEEQREIAKMGGIASGEARRRKKSLKEAFDILLDRDVPTKNGDILSGAEAIALKVYEKALKGDLRAFEILRDTAGQRPTDQLHVEHGVEGNSELSELIRSIYEDDEPKKTKKGEKK